MSNQSLLNSPPSYPPHLARRRFWRLVVAIGGMTLAPLISGAQEKPPVVAPSPDFYFIDSSIENGSPLHWDIMSDGTILISLQYDHERSSPNRATGHWHFRVEGRPGSHHTLLLQNFATVWNGWWTLPVTDKTACVLSEDGKTWHSERMDLVDGRVRIRITIPESGMLYVARIEPYRISDLDRLLAEIRPHPLVQIEPIGATVAGRPLEIVRVGSSNAPFRVFLRARAHSWEPGGNWVVQGFIRALLADTPSSKEAISTFCAYILPMANKDGVALGRTRFNLRGRDLNRNWDRPASLELAPENFALERWLVAMNAQSKRPHFALDLHNDGYGNIHLSRPNVPELPVYLASMERFERLLRQHTWFTAGSTNAKFRNPGSLGEGWLERFGIIASVLEFNANWIAAKDKMPLGTDWEEFGRNLLPVFTQYFKQGEDKYLPQSTGP